ncbi:MAG: hypothetical protein OFPII_14830 [Osedax symbiont Rs1]|nr:MAG: hypothetical protein OFPII_14830 [Osedax symbiont Rs1]
MLRSTKMKLLVKAKALFQSTFKPKLFYTQKINKNNATLVLSNDSINR